MKHFLKIPALFLFGFATLPASADLFEFTYTFDGETPYSFIFEPGHYQTGAQLTGVVEGTLLGDGDTIVVDELVSASLAGYDYSISTNAGVRGHVPGTAATISLSGDNLDIWVCVQGFNPETVDSPDYPNGGDCPFGAEGGFLLNNVAGDLALMNFTGLSINNPNPSPGIEIPAQQTIAWAGIPDLGAGTRAGDIPLNPANWSAIDVGSEAFATILDDCLQSDSSASFSSCTTRGLNDLRDAGVITGARKGALQSATSKSKGGKKTGNE